MVLIVAVAIGVALLTWHRPMAGLVLALNTNVLRSPLQAHLLEHFPWLPKEEIFYSAAFLIPSLGVLLVQLFYHYARSHRKGQTLPGFRALDLAVMGFALVLLYGCIYAPNGPLARRITITYLFLVLPFYLIGRDWLRHREDAEEQARSYMNWTLMVALSAGLIAFMENRYSLFSTPQWQLATAGANAIAFSLLIGTALLTNAYLLLAEIHSKLSRRVVLTCSLIFLAFFLAAANSRGPILGFAFSLLLIIVALLSRQRLGSLRVNLLVVIGLPTLAVGIALMAFPALSEMIAFKLGGLVNFSKSAGERLLLYSKALEYFLGSPVLGAGTGAMVARTGGYAHNMFLELAAENGLPGLIAGGIFLSSVLYYSFLSLSRVQNPICILFSGYALFYLVCAQFSMTLSHLKHLHFAAGLLVFILLSAKVDSKGDKVAGGPPL